MSKSGLTKRAADWWDSAAFSSIFLASSFFCSRSESRPTHQPLTQTVNRRFTTVAMCQRYHSSPPISRKQTTKMLNMYQVDQFAEQ